MFFVCSCMFQFTAIPVGAEGGVVSVGGGGGVGGNEPESHNVG